MRAAWISALLCLLAGCAVIPQPFPIFSYAPDAKPIADHRESPLVEQALASETAAGTRAIFMALRSGRVVGKARSTDGSDTLLKLPAPDFKPSVLGSYVSPPMFRLPEAGRLHYYNFRMSADFAAGLNGFLAGDTDTARAAFENILAAPDVQSEVGWQSSMHLAYLDLMRGRPDLAESEVQRTEAWEKKMTGGNNVYSRALRAEVRYWAGDFAGASEDAAAVVASIGDWTVYRAITLNPPRDQADVVRFSSAKIRAMNVIGMLHTARGDYDAALPWLEQAEQEMNAVIMIHKIPLYALYITANNWEIFYGQGWCLTSLATALMAKDPDSARAAEMFVHAQEFFDAIGYVAGRVLIESFKAQVLLATGRHERAEAQARLALEHARKSRLLDFVWRLETVRGQALLKLGRTEAAEESLRAAQNVVDLLSGTMVSDMAKVRFGVGKEVITRSLVDLDIRKGDWKALFQDLERGRARAFVSMLANRAVDVDRGGEITGQIQALDQAIMRERQRKYGFLQESGQEKRANREEDLLRSRQALVETLHASHPDLAEAYAVSTVELARVQKALGPGDLLVYALPAQGAEPLRLFLVTARTARVRTLAVGAEEFSAHLREFTATLWSDQDQRQRAALDRLRADLELEQWGRPDNVLVVPSGNLHFVPWAALDVTFSVGVLPTGGWIVRTAQKAKAGVQACVVGDPEFGGALPQLPDARHEAVALAKMYGTVPLIGPEATEQALRQRVARGADVLHLATHALYDPFYPLQSALILSDGRKAVPVTAEQLYKSPLSSRLVVLSACETGMGQVVSGDDLLGLTRSFYLGGANNVLSSLWPVSDEATRLFMEQFHAQARNSGYGQAWLAARNAVRARGYSPSEYGAFVLGGMPTGGTAGR